MRWISIGLAAVTYLSGTGHCLQNHDDSRIMAAGLPALLPRTDLAARILAMRTVNETHSLDRRQTAATQCGTAAGGARCTNNLCCSQWGYCGSQDEYCSNLAGCQPAYGSCEGTFTTSTSSSSTTSTTSSTTSIPTTTTTTSSTTSAAPIPSGTIISPNGQCGNLTLAGNPATCAGFAGGQCCSQFWFCGSGDAWCGTGCNPVFGVCGGSPPVTTTTSSSTSTSTSTITTTSTTSSAAPSATLPAGQTATTDGTCGNGKSCLLWTYGQCCSQFGFCGQGSVYCSPLAQCQPTYGICDPS